MTDMLLQASKITKRFEGATALQSVDFSIRRGEIHAICGENGAGKSTLIRILSGFYPWHTYEGQLLWSGQRLQLDGVRSGESIGIAVVHQEFSLIREMTIAENLFMGRLPQKGLLWDRASTIARAREMLRQFGVDLDPATIVGRLGIPMQQLVEIAKALARSPKLLILDEPTAALGPVETEHLLRSMERLRNDGVTCIYISHKLEEVLSIADRVTVLRDGRSIATYPKAECTTRKIIRDMVGRELDAIYPSKSKPVGARMPLRLDRVSAKSDEHRTVSLKGISLEVRSGEIVGIGGMMGAGRSELLLHIYGMWGTRTDGDVRIEGIPFRNANPGRALRRGIMMITEDRKRFGLIPGQTTHHNVSLSSLRTIARFGWIDPLQEHQRNQRILQRVGFRALADHTFVERLSGGNQQKVVFARGLLCEPNILLLDEPTRGVDVGARSELYREIQELADQGKAILWVSSDLSELMGMCDRIMMMHYGETAAWFERDQGFDADALMASALGHSDGSVWGTLHGD